MKLTKNETKIQGYDYPLLQKITHLFQIKSKSDAESVYICACQHILEPQEKMFELISDFGVPDDNIHILGKIYSTNFDVLKELCDKGFKVEQPDFDFAASFDEQHRANCQNLFSDFIKRVPTNSRVIVLDDGAELLLIFNEHANNLDKSIRVVGIEQTSSGFRKLEKASLNFPIINIARSPIKLDKESPLIARLGCDRINDIIKKYSIAEPRILVVGLGPIGNNVLLILREEGYFVIGHDTIFESSAEILDLVMDNQINVIIGATGSNIINEDQILNLGNAGSSIYLISMSSSDREFPASFLRKNGKSDKGIHSDATWRDVVLANNGFPITFKGKRYESTSLEIEKTIALLYGSTLYAILGSVNRQGLIDVPRAVSEAITTNE